MPNNPRLNLKKQRKPGTLDDAILKQWRAISAAEDVLYKAGAVNNHGGVLSAVHALTQAAGVYQRLMESRDLRDELQAVRDELAAVKAGMGLRKVA